MHDWAALLGGEWPDQVPLRNNVSPGALVPVFTALGGEGMRWGLIPVWATDAQNKYSTFNARLESLEEKPTFRHAWQKAQRCLLPARGYFEWRAEAGAKQPYFVTLPPDQPMVVAGLYEPARGDKIPASCTVITRAATGNMARLHARVPVVIPVSLVRQWYSLAPADAMGLLAQGGNENLSYYPVSKRVNHAANDGDDLLVPIARTDNML